MIKRSAVRALSDQHVIVPVFQVITVPQWWGQVFVNCLPLQILNMPKNTIPIRPLQMTKGCKHKENWMHINNDKCTSLPLIRWGAAVVKCSHWRCHHIRRTQSNYCEIWLNCDHIKISPTDKCDRNMLM